MTTTDGRTRTGGEHPGPADPSGHDEADGAAAPAARTPEPDGGPAVARVRARRTGPASGQAGQPGQSGQPGRHALPDDAGHTGHTPPPGYRPRHAAPDAETEQIAVPASEQPPAAQPPAAPASAPQAAAAPEAPAADSPAPPEPTPTPAPSPAEPAVASGPPTPAAPDPDAIAPTPVRGLPLASTFPASGVTASEAVPMLEGRPAVYGWRTEGEAPDGPAPERVRIVLSERRSPTRAVGTVAEIEAQTATGELLLSNLMRSQLTLALRLAAVAVLVLGVLPVVFLTMPAVSETAPVLGIGLPWLLLGVLAFPFLLVLGWLYTRHAERNELDFADDVED